MEATSRIPVVDFSAMSLQNKDRLNESNEAVKALADQLYHAFSTIGFVYLKNHGIPQEMVWRIKSGHTTEYRVITYSRIIA